MADSRFDGGDASRIEALQAAAERLRDLARAHAFALDESRAEVERLREQLAMQQSAYGKLQHSASVEAERMESRIRELELYELQRECRIEELEGDTLRLREAGDGLASIGREVMEGRAEASQLRAAIDHWRSLDG